MLIHFPTLLVACASFTAFKYFSKHVRHTVYTVFGRLSYRILHH
jgi:hypothetical protein